MTMFTNVQARGAVRHPEAFVSQRRPFVKLHQPQRP